MEGTNPYEAPQSDIEQTLVNDEFDQTSVFSPKGRFTRLSYLAWGVLMAIAAWAVMLPFASMGELLGAGDPANPLGVYFQSPVLAIVTIVSLGIGLIFGARRFHDMNLSGWWSILLLVPLVNILATIAVVFVPGKPQANKYGPPRHTRTWEKWVGLILPVIFLIGILAAVSIPAYNAYIEAAREAAAAAG